MFSTFTYATISDGFCKDLIPDFLFIYNFVNITLGTIYAYTVLNRIPVVNDPFNFILRFLLCFIKVYSLQFLGKVGGTDSQIFLG